MAVFSDLADLFVAAGEYSGRADFAHLFPRFVAIAENEMERDARYFSEQHSYSLLTLSSNVATLPVDFLSVRSVSADGDPSYHLQHVSKHLDQTNGETGPIGYVIDGNTLRMVRNSSIAKVRLNYYAKLPRLTSVAPTNWLLDRAGEAIMANIVAQIFSWGGDAEKAAAARIDYETRIARIIRDEKTRRFQNAQIVPAGGLP